MYYYNAAVHRTLFASEIVFKVSQIVFCYKQLSDCHLVIFLFFFLGLLVFIVTSISMILVTLGFFISRNN